jgi:hypothetical protein
MFNPRSERIADGAGNVFFLAAIILFITLIILATGTVRAQDAPEPDALAPEAGVQAVPKMNEKTRERSQSVPAVVERSPGRAQRRVK